VHLNAKRGHLESFIHPTHANGQEETHLLLVFIQIGKLHIMLTWPIRWSASALLMGSRGAKRLTFRRRTLPEGTRARARERESKGEQSRDPDNVAGALREVVGDSAARFKASATAQRALQSIAGEDFISGNVHLNTKRGTTSQPSIHPSIHPRKWR